MGSMVPNGRARPPQMLAAVVESHAVRVGARFSASFQRTLRIPDDGQVYPLPPGLGAFPLFEVKDDAAHRAALPAARPGDAFLPMYQREALWVGFGAAPWKPNAVRVAVGRVNALTGRPEADDDGSGGGGDPRPLRADPQNYLVCPDQPWLDGINVGAGVIRQFVAMPLGQGYSVEAAVTGEERFGGIRLTVYEPKPGRFPDHPPPAPAGPRRMGAPSPAPGAGAKAAGAAMGLGAGGTMKQKIYPDRYGIDTWDAGHFGRVTVHIVNSEQFRQLTGSDPPPSPVSAKTYTDHGLPWFELYDDAKSAVAPPESTRRIKSVAERDRERGKPVEDPSVDVPPEQIARTPPAPSPRPRGPDRSNT